MLSYRTDTAQQHISLVILNVTRMVKKKQEEPVKSGPAVFLSLDCNLCQRFQGVGVGGPGVHKDRTCQPIA